MFGCGVWVGVDLCVGLCVGVDGWLGHVAAEGKYVSVVCVSV